MLKSDSTNFTIHGTATIGLLAQGPDPSNSAAKSSRTKSTAERVKPPSRHPAAGDRAAEKAVEKTAERPWGEDADKVEEVTIVSRRQGAAHDQGREGQCRHNLGVAARIEVPSRDAGSGLDGGR